MKLNKIRAFFFDLDGVLSVGKENPRALGGHGVVAKIKSLGKKAFVLTNDSTHTREELRANLLRMGFDFSTDEILTSSFLTAHYLTQKIGKSNFFLVGERGLLLELEAAGHQPTQDKPDVVVVGLDRHLTYDKLDRAMRSVRNGATLVGSYGGAVYMSDHGPALSAGPIVKALEFASGKRAIMIGKPSPRMFKLALTLSGAKASDAIMIGDQIETDLSGARRAGVHTALVLTGVETMETVRNSKLKPDLVLETVDELADYI